MIIEEISNKQLEFKQSESKSFIKQESKSESKITQIIEPPPPPQVDEDDDDKMLSEYLVKEEIKLTQSFNSPTKSADLADYYLKNFTQAIESVLNQQTFACLFDQSDYAVIKRFSLLSSKRLT